MLEIRTPGPLPEDAESILVQEAPWGWAEEESDSGSTIRIHFPSSHRAEQVADTLRETVPSLRLRIEPSTDMDWAESWKEFFDPIFIGSTFLVAPPWKVPEQPSRTTICIEPKMAFGTGQHPSTFLCLLALEHLKKSRLLPSGGLFLDLGTGSGILGIALSLLGMRGIGLDLDPVAAENARENAVLNHVEARFTPAVGSLPAIGATRFNLIMANILAEPLVKMAPGIVPSLRPGGGLILSGLLQEQEDRVISAYRDQGLPCPHVLHKEEWSALVWEPVPDNERS